MPDDESGGANEAAATMKASILTTTADVNPENFTNVYYVAASGTLGAAGTKQAPLSVDAVNTLSLNSGDAVLFNRGDTFVLSEAINTVSGVTYAAYGDGDKPLFLGSLKNYAASGNSWYHAGQNGQEGFPSSGIWGLGLPTGVSVPDNVIFNGGEVYGTKKDGEAGQNFSTVGDWCYNSTHNTIFVYSPNGNPSEVFDDIQIFTTNSAFSGVDADNVTIDNLAMKYFGIHTVHFTTSLWSNVIENITVTNCEVGFGGGGTQDGVRLGNGIEIYGWAKNININNNYVYEQYDAGITFQFTGVAQYDNINIKNNLVEKCSYNIEYFITDDGSSASSAWQGNKSHSKNIDISGNILRFAGYGLGMVRNDAYGVANFNAWTTKFDTVENFKIQNNIFDCSAKNLVNWAWNNSWYEGAFGTQTFGDKLTISGNSFYQKAYDISTSPVTNKNTLVENAAMWYGNNQTPDAYGSVTATNDTELLAAVQAFDSSVTAENVAYIEAN